MISGLFGFGGLAALEIHGIIGVSETNQCRSSGIFHRAACVSSEREHSLQIVSPVGDMGSVCRSVPPLDLLHDSIRWVSVHTQSAQGNRDTLQTVPLCLTPPVLSYRIPSGIRNLSAHIRHPDMPSTSTIKRNLVASV